jgi:hypothetical protein
MLGDLLARQPNKFYWEDGVMRRVVSAEVWKRKTVQFAISVMRLIQLMNAVAEVELRWPARECPGCKQVTEVVVVPEGLCGNCWSKKAIAAWKVLPLGFATVRVNGARARITRRRK